MSVVGQERKYLDVTSDSTLMTQKWTQQPQSPVSTIEWVEFNQFSFRKLPSDNLH